jgi:type II secretory pathway component GspD/PulD (secretin)
MAVQEAYSVLYQAFYNSATLIPRYTTGELLVFAASEVHQKIADSIVNFDVARPEGTKHVAKTYDLSDLPTWWFNFAQGHIPGAVGQYVSAFASGVPGQLVVWAKPADHVEVEAIIAQMRSDNADVAMKMEIYTVRRGGTTVSTIIYSLIPQIAPHARPYAGTNANQIVVMAKASDHVKVKEAIDKLNESDIDISLRPYRTGAQRSQTAITFLSQQFPGLLVYPVSPSEVLAWATTAEHETIAQLMETFAKTYPDPVLKPYYFKYVTLSEGYTYIYQAFSSMVTTMTPRSSGDLLVYTTPEIHEKIAASIAEFDVPRPEGTEMVSKVYDLSDLPAQWFYYVWSYIPVALEYRVRTSGGMPGQMIVWGKPADLEKVDKMIDGILAERPGATSFTQVYTLQRGTNVQHVTTAMAYIAPNAKYTPGTNPNEVLIWARDTDHLKIGELVDTLNESEPDIQIELHSLRNVDYYTATGVITRVIEERGLDVRLYNESYGHRLVALARPEDQKMIAEILDSLRTEDRFMLPVTLRSAEAYAVQTAISTMLYDESYAARPMVRIDENTNMVFVYATAKQLEKIARMLRDMDEDVWYPEKPEAQRRPGTVGFQPRGNIREIRGGAELLKELEKRWKQSQPNQLRIITPKEEETPSLYSVEDEIQRENTDGRQQTADGSTEESEQIAIFEPSPVYVVVKADGSLTVVSEDTAALDRLEMLLNRISTGIVAEGRDYTIYSVSNISANAVYQRLLLPLKDKLNPTQARFTGTARSPIPLTIQPDITANTIIVWGSKADRMEVGKLIALFDVSELPGERIVTKPKTVPIENTEANRVWNEVMKVYRVKLGMTQLPGGITPQIIVNNTTNSLEIFAPEPLSTELAEYIKEVDNKAQDEPGRKLHVIQTGVKASVIEAAILDMQRRMRMQMQPYGMQPYGYPYPSPYPYPYPGGVRGY